MSSQYPLLGSVKVVEFSDDVGAAFCGHILTQLGADVRKLRYGQSPTSIEFESVSVGGGGSAAQVAFDRNKHVIAIDEGDLKGLARELQAADLILTDHSPERLAELGISVDPASYDDNGQVLVVVSVFGIQGRYAGWKGGDLEAQALSGVCSQLGVPESQPLSLPYKSGLLHAGLNAAAAASLALYNRAATGNGCVVDISAAQVLASNLRNYSLMMRYYNLPLKRSGRRPPGSLGRYPSAIFKCKDGYVALIARSAQQYQAFIEMMGNPPWASNPRYQDAYGMAVEYPDEMDDLVNPWLATRTKSELSELGIVHKFPVGALRLISELFDDEQYRHRSFFEKAVVGGDEYVVPGLPSIFHSPD